ncbi:hypothetical protein [Endozoicomonas acroporae]|uniref:hypothetical protein n=1 Tax=Endozoicomonas acroporae TaxID=1701104 RepID=UPI003D7A60E4
MAKVDNIHFDAVLHDSHDEDHFYLEPLAFPEPMSSLVIDTIRHGDEQKLSDALYQFRLLNMRSSKSFWTAGQGGMTSNSRAIARNSNEDPAVQNGCAVHI